MASERLFDTDIHARLVEALDLSPADIQFDTDISGPVWYGFRLHEYHGSLCLASDARYSQPIPGKTILANGIRVVDVTGDCWESENYETETSQAVL